MTVDLRFVETGMEDEGRFFVVQRFPGSAAPDGPFVVYERKEGAYRRVAAPAAPDGFKFCPYSNAAVISGGRLWACVQTAGKQELGYVIGLGLERGVDPITMPVNYPALTIFGPRVPTAMHARAGTIYVGLPGEVLVADLDAKPPKLTSIFTFDEPHARKAIDAIVTSDVHMVAVDDVIMPKYLFVFDIKNDARRPRHLFTQDLGMGASLTYHDAAINGRLLALRSSTHRRMSRTETLDLFELRDVPGAKDAGNERTQGARDAKGEPSGLAFSQVATAHAVAHADESGMETPTLPEWRGMVLSEGKLLVASLTDGLQLLAPSGETLAVVAKVDGAFLDVARRGSRLLALRMAAQGLELVEAHVDWKGGKLRVDVLQPLAF